MIRGLFEINDREIAGLRQRLPLHDAQADGLGKARESDAVYLPHTETAAPAHFQGLSDRRGRGDARHSAYRLNIRFRDDHIGRTERNSLPSLAEHDLDADVGVALSAFPQCAAHETDSQNDQNNADRNADGAGERPAGMMLEIRSDEIIHNGFIHKATQRFTKTYSPFVSLCVALWIILSC